MRTPKKNKPQTSEERGTDLDEGEWKIVGPNSKEKTLSAWVEHYSEMSSDKLNDEHHDKDRDFIKAQLEAWVEHYNKMSSDKLNDENHGKVREFIKAQLEKKEESGEPLTAEDHALLEKIKELD